MVAEFEYKQSKQSKCNSGYIAWSKMKSNHFGIPKPLNGCDYVARKLYLISSHLISSHLISYIISYHITYRIISYHIISYHIISYHIIYIISYHLIWNMTWHDMTSYPILSFHKSYDIISYIISYHIISYHIISYHIISYHSISYHTIPYHTISYHIISYHIMSYHIISCIKSYHHIIYKIIYMSQNGLMDDTTMWRHQKSPCGILNTHRTGVRYTHGFETRTVVWTLIISIWSEGARLTCLSW